VRGNYTNTAVVSGGGSSNTASASVAVVAGPAFDNATLLGKVFHDRDEDGYQDSATATGITISSASGFLGDSAHKLGELRGRASGADKPHSLVVRIPVSTDNRFVVRSKEGTILSVDNDLNVTESHVGLRAHGRSAQELSVTTRFVDAIPTRFKRNQQILNITRVLEITISNRGLIEEGLPGVRLASVNGLVVETDKYGRFHIPDVSSGSSGIGQQMILKLDTATIPPKARLTTENPRVLRVTSSALNTMRFGVRLPVDDVAEAARGDSGQSIEVHLGSVFFDTDKHHIRSDQRGAIADIIKHLKKHGSGQIFIQAHTDSRNSRAYNIALAKRRAKTVERKLREALGESVVENVKVKVDASAYTGGTDKPSAAFETSELGE